MYPNIQQALKYLENANISGYFEEMDQVAIPNLQMKSTYAQFKGVFMSGQAPWNFSQQLEVFAKEVDNLMESSSENINNISTQEKDGLLKAKAMWIKKLNFLKEREPLIIDPTQQFAIAVQIAEIEEKIREIDKKLGN